MKPIDLPWPSKDLSPNGRLHWARLAKAKANFRWACYLLTMGVKPSDRVVPPGKLRLVVTFHARDRKRRDRDNLLASMKAGVDGMCEALRIDDVRFAEVVVRMADGAAKEPFVRLEIEANTKGVA